MTDPRVPKEFTSLDQIALWLEKIPQVAGNHSRVSPEAFALLSQAVLFLANRVQVLQNDVERLKQYREL